MKSYRKDSFTIDGFEFTANGFLNISGIVTRTGVFKYDDGAELRPANEIFKEESLKTMFAMPVTREHPPDLLSVDTVPLYQKGFVASEPIVEKSDSENGIIKLKNIIIQDKNLINEVTEKKISQFSLGYSCDLEEMSGNFLGEDYVRVQKNVIYNHLALVKEARCGEVCSIIKGDSMLKKEYKADCACQDVRKDSEKPEDKEKDKKDESDKDEKKKDEDDTPSWAKKILELLTKMSSVDSKKDSDEEGEKEKSKVSAKEKEEDKKDADSDEDDDDLYDEKSKDSKKDKRKDSIQETMSSFKFTDKEFRTDSTYFTKYDRDSYAQSIITGDK